MPKNQKTTLPKSQANITSPTDAVLPKKLPPQQPLPPSTVTPGGFDGDAEPYDNYLAAQMAQMAAEYEKREKKRSRLQNLAQSKPKGADKDPKPVPIA